MDIHQIKIIQEESEDCFYACMISKETGIILGKVKVVHVKDIESMALPVELSEGDHIDLPGLSALCTECETQLKLRKVQITEELT